MNMILDASRYHYDLGFLEGYMSCKKGYHKRAIECRKRQIETREKFLYFLKQKLLGIATLILTVLSIWLLDGDVTIGVIMLPLGLVLIFSNKPLIYGEYYFCSSWGEYKCKTRKMNITDTDEGTFCGLYKKVKPSTDCHCKVFEERDGINND